MRSLVACSSGVPDCGSTLGVAYARSGRSREALQFAHEAVADAERMRLIVDRAALLVRLGQVSLITGRIEDALKLGKQAVEIAVAHEAKGDEAWARFLIARTCWASDPQNLDECAKQLDLALGLAIACEAVRWLRFAKRCFGASYARRGDPTSARKSQRGRRCKLPGTRHDTAALSIRCVRTLGRCRNPHFHRASCSSRYSILSPVRFARSRSSR